MAIFSSKNEVYDIDVPVIEGYSSEVNGNMDACIEAFDDQLAVIEAMHALDIKEIALENKIKELEEEGASEEEIDEVKEELEEVTEASVKEIWNRILAMLKKLWAKITAFFNSIVAHFDAMFKSSKEFAAKYEKKVTKDAFDFKCYDWAKADLDKQGDLIASAITGAYNEIERVANYIGSKTKEQIENDKEITDLISEDGKKDFYNGLRSDLVGKKVDADDFADEVFEKLHGGDKNSKEERKVKAADYIKYLKEGKVSDAVKKVKNATDSSFKNYIAKIDKMGKEAEKATKDADGKPSSDGTARASYISKLSSLFSSSKAIVNQYTNMWKSAASERDRAARAIVLRAYDIGIGVRKNEK